MADLDRTGFGTAPTPQQAEIPPGSGIPVDHFDEAYPSCGKKKNGISIPCFWAAHTIRNGFWHNGSPCAASVTKFAAPLLHPAGVWAQVKAVQFAGTSRRTAMLILMSSAGTRRNRVFHCDFDLTSEILRVFFRVFNER